MAKSLVVHFNGSLIPEADAKIHILAPAVQYAATVFEGLRGYWNADHKQMYLFRLEEHMRRLEYSMKIMRFEPPLTADQFRTAIIETIRANDLKEDIHLRIFAYLDGPPNITATGPVRVAITAGPYPKNIYQDKGMACAVSSWSRLGDNMSPPRLKVTANYNNGRLAALQAKTDGYDAAIMLSSTGYVAEGPQANVFVVREGKIMTPRVIDGILESITRRTVIELLQEEQGIATEERAIGRTELYAAEEMFYVGSGWEIRPITSVDRLPVGDGQVGPIVKKIMQSYFNCVRNVLGRRKNWLTPVW
jgi:branched-chain amino acid aminotransferase